MPATIKLTIAPRWLRATGAYEPLFQKRTGRQSDDGINVRKRRILGDTAQKSHSTSAAGRDPPRANGPLSGTPRNSGTRRHSGVPFAGLPNRRSIDSRPARTV